MRLMIRALLLFAGMSLPWLAIAADFSPIPGVSSMKDVAKAPVPFDLVTLKRNWKQRIEAMRAAGVMPLIDIESNPSEDMDIQSFARQMDKEGVALINGTQAMTALLALSSFEARRLLRAGKA